MPRNVADLEGMTFGKVSVIKRHEHPSKRATFWACKCECGNELISRSSDLTGLKVKSCGCMPKKSPNQTYVTMEGETRTLREWADSMNMCTGGVLRRINKGGFTLTRDDSGRIKHYHENDDYSDLADVQAVTGNYWDN